MQAPLKHHLLKVSIAKRIPQVSTHTEQNNLGLEVTPYEWGGGIRAIDSSQFSEYHRAYYVLAVFATQPVPEPELVIVVNAHAEIIGYTIGNDVSSRSIEGENPLYLPQAKVYRGCCALGPGITPVWEISDPYNLGIQLSIERKCQMYWKGSTNTRELNRRFDELIDHLFREDDFPEGVLLCTGTALVPERPFTLETGDVVQNDIERIGTLRYPVVVGNHRLARY